MIARYKNVRLCTEGATRNDGKLEGGFYEKGDRELNGCGPYGVWPGLFLFLSYFALRRQNASVGV